MFILKKKLFFGSKNYLAILSLLNINNSESRLIGGCVRDALIKKVSSDTDIATTLLPQEIVEILESNNIRFITIGIEFGTVTAFIQDERFEITTLRKDLSSDGRHPKVKYCSDFFEDAQRRDFTINALSYCPFREEIYDYFGGITHIRERQVIFIGDPSIRINEDHLRILRFFRFSHVYAKDLDTAGLNACIDLKNQLLNLSRERIKWEIDKIINTDHSEIILETLSKIGILEIILPVKSIDPKVFNRTFMFAKENNIKFETYIKYVLILFEITDLSIKALTDLKFSKNNAKKIFDIINFIKNFHQFEQKYILEKTWIEEDNYIHYILAAVGLDKLPIETAEKFIHIYKSMLKPQFMINGYDLIELGITKTMISKILHNLKKKWIESNFKLSKPELLKELK